MPDDDDDDDDDDEDDACEPVTHLQKCWYAPPPPGPFPRGTRASRSRSDAITRHIVCVSFFVVVARRGDGGYGCVRCVVFAGPQMDGRGGSIEGGSACGFR